MGLGKFRNTKCRCGSNKKAKDCCLYTKSYYVPMSNNAGKSCGRKLFAYA